MATYNPFPETGTEPVWINSGVCYSTAWYADKADAEKVAEVVRAKGGTVNGGYMDGLPLGELIPSRGQWGVTF